MSRDGKVVWVLKHKQTGEYRYHMSTILLFPSERAAELEVSHFIDSKFRDNWKPARVRMVEEA